jgi:methionine synthase I (cobalamin-dependent)
LTSLTCGPDSPRRFRSKAMDSMDEIIQRATQGEVIVFDGAMGTMLQSRVPGLSFVEEANLTAPEVVAEIHRAYVEAGARAVTTNSLCANRIHLARHGLADQARELARLSAQIAREAVGAAAWVAGSIGPVGQMIAPLGPVEVDDLRSGFAESARGLADGGADFILIETMYNLDEALIAVEAAMESGLPVAATMTFESGGKTVMGNAPADCARRLGSRGARILGANCSTGPEEMLPVAEEMRQATDLPLLIQPNAGKPRLEGGRTIFDATPELMAEYARRYVEAGVEMVGTCCGSTPEHTRAIADAVCGPPRDSH